MSERYQRSDPAFSAWLEQNPKGYVLNTSRDLADYQYPKLHRASCRSFSRADLIPADIACVCSKDQGELESIANGDYGRVTYCGICRP